MVSLILKANAFIRQIEKVYYITSIKPFQLFFLLQGVLSISKYFYEMAISNIDYLLCYNIDCHLTFISFFVIEKFSPFIWR